MPDRRDDILNHVSSPDYRPVKPKVIAKKIGAAGEAAEAVRKQIKRLVKEGLLAFGPSHVVYPVANKAHAGDANPSPSPSLRGRRKAKHEHEHVVGTFRRAEAGFGFVRPDRFQAGFAADVNDADAAFLRDSQLPIAMSAFETRLTQAAWRSKPSWAIIATEDRAFGEGMLRGMAQRIGATIVEVPGSHAAFLTQPAAIADAIDRAARSVSQTSAN